MVTIRMIAKECGCSPATVSKALNGAEDVNAETAQRIRKAASQMGYLPNAAARALKTSRSHIFGVLIADFTNSGLTHEFFSRILNSFKRRAEELGYDIFFLSDHLGSWASSYVEHARYRNCDGIFIATALFSDPDVSELAICGIPVVTLDYLYANCGAVHSDNLQGMRDLVSYVYSQGHRKIAFIHGEDTSVTRVRVAGFYRACRDLGLSIPEEYVLTALYHDPDASASATKKLLSLPDPPTCILYPDDISYIGGMNQIVDMGLQIPKDISAAGFDGIKIGQMLRPRLTTIHQDAELMGVKAAEELAKAAEEGKLYIPSQTTIPCRLLPGGTVGKIR